MSRSLRALALSATLLGAVVAVAVAPAAAQTPTDLSLWVFVDRHGTFIQHQAERWNAAFPDRPITVTFSAIEYTQMHDNLLASFIGGAGAPDLVDIEIGKFALFTKSDTIHLLDLTDVVTPYLPDIVATRMAPYTARGMQLGIDYHLGAYLMYYNKALLDAAGIDPDAIKTWDDWVAAGKTFQEKTPGVSWAAVEEDGPFSARGLMLMNGGGAYDGSGNLQLTAQANIDALQRLSDFVNVDKVAVVAAGGDVHSAEFYASLQSGQVASLFMPQWYMTRFRDNLSATPEGPWSGTDMCGHVIVRPMPIFAEGGFTTTMGGGTGTAVTDQAPAEEQQLAKEFLAFAKLTKEGQTALWTDLGFDPFRPDVYDDPALTVADPCFSGEVTFNVLKSQLGNVAPEYTGPLYPEVQTIFTTDTIPGVLSGGIAPADALQAAQDQVLAGG